MVRHPASAASQGGKGRGERKQRQLKKVESRKLKVDRSALRSPLSFPPSTLSRSATYLPPPDISGHFLPGTGDAARERGSLRWWRKETGMANGCGFGVVLFMLPEVRILLSLV